ncbi:MAG: hypothetical protein ACE5NP_03140 [Anaerolineae bacterium]
MIRDSKLESEIVIVVVLLLLASLLACELGRARPTAEVIVVTPTPVPVAPTPPPEAPAQPLPTGRIIVDNADPGFTIEAGDWGTCENGDCQGTPYGADFRFADPTCISCRARFDFSVTTAGEYDVWTWWPWGEDRATDTPFTIVYSGGPMTVNVDQRNNGDAWYWLATLPFEAEEPVSIVIEATSTGYANADAVALTLAGTGSPGESVVEAPVTEVTGAPTPISPLPGGGFRVMFLHHSVGANLIEQGGVRQRLTDLGYEFYDHGYNEDGLVLADGTWTGRNFDVPDDNTDPDGFAVIFAQPLHDPPDNTFSQLMQYDAIAFKSCFPTSLIESDAQLAQYKSYYLSIRDRMDQYPNKVFIVVTQPPEIPNDTDPQAAARARAFSDWLASDEYLSGHPNVFTFNLFDLLADPSTNMLRAEYQTDEWDAHPNELANRTIGPLFVNFIDQAIRTYTAR